ncbi:MAG: Enoyl-CoA hydratase / short chain enoyl-CoA hydratase [Rhodospirillaceae bacterium]|nr:MAG: Enoyl-CoA hydratase / short chain enoyl-CoA hydratase [Rhodospirillaceae bacterium]
MPENGNTDTTDAIVVARDGPIATVFLNRPERRNALDRSMWQTLGDVCAALGQDSSLRCLILRGTGGKAFAAGADIDTFETERGDPATARTYDRIMRRALAAVRDHPYPVVAAIEGACLGGGLALAAVADLRLCGQGSRFGVPVSRLGLPMPIPEIETIMRLTGPAPMLEILLEARIFGAEKAFALGLVHRVVADDAVGTEAFATAQRIAAGAPLVHRWHRRFVRRLLDPTPVTDADLEEGHRFFDTEDYREGLAAFREKRAPLFKGK